MLLKQENIYSGSCNRCL